MNTAERHHGTRIALALGSGGARGYAHIGAIQVLREHGFTVETIAGTSMGAVVGAALAGGKLDEFSEWVCTLRPRDVIRLADVRITGPGVLRASSVINVLGEILQIDRIEDLAIPFTAVATDLDARREVWFQNGPLDVALRASIAIPWVFKPVDVGGRVLVDGGLMNPVPIEPTRAVPTDLTIAISLDGPIRNSRGVGCDPEASPERPGSGQAGSFIPGSVSNAWQSIATRTKKSSSELWESLTESFSSSAASIRGTFSGQSDSAGSSAATTTADSEAAAARQQNVVDQALVIGAGVTKELTMQDLVGRSFNTMSALVTRYRMAANPPDVLISLPSDMCGSLDFHRAAEMIENGRNAATEALTNAGVIASP